jgi:AAA family ATP:ADP antiporter
VLAQVIQQIVGYGLMTPAQHVLFTVVPREDKFQAKGFIDTVIFRFSDVAASNVTRWMGLLHQSLSRLAIALIPLMLLWLLLAVWLGREHRRRTAALENPGHGNPPKPVT